MDVFFRENGLEKLNQVIMYDNDRSLQTQALWTLSNIACDSEKSATILAQNDIFNTIAFLMGDTTDLDIKKESTMTIGNLFTCLPVEVLDKILTDDDDLLKNYMEGLKMISDKNLINNILNTIEHFGELDKRFMRQGPQSFIGRIELSNGLEHLEELQKLPHEDIYHRVVNLLTKYWEIEDSSMEAIN